MKAIIAAAGTGGHINPALAIANKIKQEEPNSEIIFVGTDRGLENDLIPRGYDLKRIEAYGFNRKISLDNVKKMYKTFKSIGQAKKIIQDFKPDIMIGTGGYICLPVALAASKLNVPIVLHESNAFPGVAIKMLSKKASAILVGFEDAKKRIKNAENVVVVGNPSKVKEISFTNSQKEKILKEIGLTDIEKPIVLVFGGSQGAQKINESFINIISKKVNEKYQIIWATGPNQYEIIKTKLQNLNINIDNIPNVKILPYIYNMEEVMNCVDLVVSRSGAMTITEISIVGKPSIFIPFPYATENHQEYNAKVLEKVGAAKIILDADLDFNILNSTINEIISDKEKMCRMSENAHAVEIKNVEDKIYVELRRIMEMEKH